jgi:diguanylate cyclase (GGDEF)-like protein/PAS domain S-box-containing protein
MTPTAFELLYNEAPCGLVSTDRDGVITDANDTFVELSGYTRDQLIGRVFRDLLAPGSQLFHETRFQPVLRLNGSVDEVALTIRRADAVSVAVVVNARISTNPRDDSEVVRLAVIDSTQRKDYERELLSASRAAEASERRVAVMQTATTSFSAADSESALAADLLARSKDAFDAADAAVVLLNPSGHARVAAGEYLSFALSRLWQAHPDRDALREIELLTVSSMDDAERISSSFADILRSLRMEGLTAVALTAEQQVVGVLVNFFSRERQFDEHTAQLQLSLARQAALVLGRIRLQHELHEMAMHDQLTGLANRNLLRERLAQAIAEAAQGQYSMALLFLDLDGFKQINDDLGHRVGDEVLQTVAKRIDGVVRDADVVGRFGGDEFLVVCDHADEIIARGVAERIVDAIAEPFRGLPTIHGLSASLGIAVYVPGGERVPDNDSLVRAADAAMYESKKAGPGRVSVTRV